MNRIIDESGDKNFFTIVPNYILNHSSAIDQAVYMQMKKAAGEKGECFITEDNLCKKMKIGRIKLRNSIEYLISHKWISFIGRTRGKTRPVNTYKVNDIWKLNARFYKKKIPSRSAVSSFVTKDTVQNEKDTVQISSKIPSRSTMNKNQLLIRTNKKIVPSLNKFSKINSLGEKEFEEIAKMYQVPIAFVRSKYDDMINWHESSGKTKKNWLATLRNWVKKDALKIKQDHAKGNIKAGIDATNQ